MQQTKKINKSSFSKYDYVNLNQYDYRFMEYIKPYLEIKNDPFPKEYNLNKIVTLLPEKMKANDKIRNALKVAAKRYPKEPNKCMLFKLNINDSAGNKEHAKKYKAHLKKMEEEQSKTMPKFVDISHFEDVLSMMNKDKQAEFKANNSWNENFPKQNFPNFNMNHFGNVQNNNILQNQQKNSEKEIFQSITSDDAAPSVCSYSQNEKKESNFSVFNRNDYDIDDVINGIENMKLNKNIGNEKNNQTKKKCYNNDKNAYNNNANDFWKNFRSNDDNSKKIYSNDENTPNIGAAYEY